MSPAHRSLSMIIGTTVVAAVLGVLSSAEAVSPTVGMVRTDCAKEDHCSFDPQTPKAHTAPQDPSGPLNGSHPSTCQACQIGGQYMDPVHCHGECPDELVSTERDQILRAAREGDYPELIRMAILHPEIALVNFERSAVQVRACGSEDLFVANIPIEQQTLAQLLVEARSAHGLEGRSTD